MNLKFFRKKNNESGLLVNNKNVNLPTKPYSETGPRPIFLWKILTITFLILGICLIFFIIFSYQFLTQDRLGAVDNNSSSTPKINANKIEKINTFFNERLKTIESSYQKTIVDPGLN